MTLGQAFVDFPDLKTDRLYLRQMRSNDADALFGIKSNPEVTRQHGQGPHQTIEQTRNWIQQRMEDYGKQSTIYWVCTFKGKEDDAIGAICFWNFDSAFNCAELGYELNPSHWGKGIMSEALAAILTYGFNAGLHRIEANPFAFNESSIRLLQKLGFKHEGTLRERYFFRGEFVDQLYFGMLKNEWMNSSLRAH
jgi:ribosomal-protein-alanine N-acetyltransferase